VELRNGDCQTGDGRPNLDTSTYQAVLEKMAGVRKKDGLYQKEKRSESEGKMA